MPGETGRLSSGAGGGDERPSPSSDSSAPRKLAKATTNLYSRLVADAAGRDAAAILDRYVLSASEFNPLVYRAVFLLQLANLCSNLWSDGVICLMRVHMHELLIVK